MSATYFQNKTLESFLTEIRNGNKFVCFGAGRFAIHSLKTMLNPNDIHPEYFVDNACDKHGCEFQGYAVKPPRELLSLNLDRTLILITTLSPFPVKKQAEELGANNIYASCFFFEAFMGKHYINISMK